QRRQEMQQNRRDRAAAPDRRAPLAMDRRPNGAAQARWSQFQRNVQAQHRFQGGFWRPPPGYLYRRWSYGQILPGLYFARNYWITNWITYGLFAPPAGLVWVRYGSDALLVDRVTGQIVQVQYGIFY
ncbi:MAG TPA: RcnB family protein, partial [Caulobacteraceae bacterium]|nr:RcnB family protein [Caulobacteraceae bacterium]